MFKRLLTITLLAFVVAFIGPAWSYDTAMAETVASDTGAPATVNPETPRLMPGKGMMHGGGRHGKGEGGMMQGCGQHGKGKGQGQGQGQGGMMQGGGQHGKGGHEKDRQVIQRLDMIEARMAKIEAMLETLVRR
jgi:hypothetical protein